MQFVDVPVPEELADEVRQFVLRQAIKAGGPTFDAEAVAGAIASLDEPCRRLLAAVAGAAVDGSTTTIAEIGRLLECAEREALGTMVEVNVSMWAIASVPEAIACRAPAANRQAKSTLAEQVMVMDEGLARAVGVANQSVG